MSILLCTKCGEHPVFVKKSGLCQSCYARNQKKKRSSDSQDQSETGNNRELKFVKNFFNHFNWTHHAVTFRLDDVQYTPDFYDAERNAFIEVAGTRQAYEGNLFKYHLMKKNYPKIIFEVRQVTGTLIDIDERVHWDNEEERNNP